MIDQAALRAELLEITNSILVLEGSSTFVDEIRLVTAPAFFDDSYGTVLLEGDDRVVMRVSIGRPEDQVADTIVHETAHVLLGPEHIDNPDHGDRFQSVYQDLREKYMSVVMEGLRP
jgi:hypothetical protein